MEGSCSAPMSHLERGSNYPLGASFEAHHPIPL